MPHDCDATIEIWKPQQWSSDEFWREERPVTAENVWATQKKALFLHRGTRLQLQENHAGYLGRGVTGDVFERSM